ncbi:hypothetical protein K435DRAFT_961137 [Dendrothele bispora CBS 962.96]|uniref:Vacuolar sorting protein 39/Transforming growth factor beta receptor-associated domain-containing protein n=1 Tax=Dendrothele bispora (strain CBS 962.96) TaxID=1314807 RepID=A0A4S8MRX2_DENBC|nr:hypothetical protein K435DRAFT_961137 [Dendrothele bispora CBS 962.96]
MLHSSSTTFPRSSILLLGANSIQSLVPATLISQIESLLESHRIEDAVDLADQQRKKLESSITVNEDELEELRFVYQRIGFQCFSETLFEDAGKNLFNGELDPRLLVSYYPELRGSLFKAEDTMDVFAGVAENMPPQASVDDIIRNYSPHLDTRSAPPTAELRKILGMAAQEMLELFLRKCRTRRKVDDEQSSSRNKRKWEVTYPVVDTVLVKLYAQFEKTKDLYALLQEPNDVVVDEVESALQKNGQYNALCVLYKQRGLDDKLLESWAKVIDGEWLDEDIKDPVADMISLLNEKKNRSLTQKWGLWLTKRDPDRGLKLLMPRDNGKRRDKGEEDFALLEQIKQTSPAAVIQFLEYLILQKRSTSKDIHMQYAVTCVEQLVSFASQDAVSKLWRAKASSYSSSRSESTVPFIQYFASTTPDSEHKRVRLKTALFLQGSSLYDAASILSQLQQYDKLLKLEIAIVEGKLAQHRSVLLHLVNDLNDARSAEAYCALGGEVVPKSIASSIIDNTEGLQAWKGSSLFAQSSSKRVDDTLKKELLKLLLEVYMDGSESNPERAAQLLNAQANNLDAVDVISMIPPTWSLKLMSSFLTRSFRRTLHQRHEAQIVKPMTAGQNLEVKDRTWLILREEGMIVEEAIDGEDYENEVEKAVLDEKAALHLNSDSQPPTAVDILPSESPKNEPPSNNLLSSAEYESDLENSDVR